MDGHGDESEWAFAPTGGSALLRPRVLLADDHCSVLEAVSNMLSPYADIVGTAKDGASLVSEALRLRPDVIVRDIAMPILNGVAGAQRLAARGWSRTPQL